MIVRRMSRGCDMEELLRDSVSTCKVRWQRTILSTLTTTYSR